MLHPQVLVGVALERGPADVAVGTRHEGGNGALRDLVKLAVGTDGRREFQVGIGQHAVH